MAFRQEVRRRRPAPRLCLVTPGADDAVELWRLLEPALQAADIAAVLLRLPPLEPSGQGEFIKAVAPQVQHCAAALLVEGPAESVVHSVADGAHVMGEAEIRNAVCLLKPARIVGAGGLRTRHEAMVAGEVGVDYVLFGEPDEAGRQPPFAAVLERIAWWSEIFEIPCMGFAASLDQIGDLSAAGADFVALCDRVWTDARGPAAVVLAAAQELHSVELV